MKNLLKHHVVYKNIALFYLIVSLLTRVILLIHPITQSHFSFVDYLKIFSFGILNDLFVFVLIGFILWLYLIFISDSKFKKPYGYLILGIFVCTLLYIASGKSILSEYGGVLPEIGLAFVGLKTILFALLLFFEKNRKKIRFVLFSFTIFLFVLLIIQNAVSEFFFWNEFGVRYNFIAVDYLVYTNTVIGNIMESYPVVPLFSIIGIVSVLSTYFIIQKSKKYLDEIPNIKAKISIVLGQLALIALALFTIPNLAKKEDSSNVFTNELQSNGLYKFYLAFMNSELDFMKFYDTLPENELANFENTTHIKLNQNTVHIQPTEKEIHKNVVLITIESMSAEFMKHYGNTENITPFLDELADKSLFFTNLYATGNRTVRGLEAVTLCLPPTPGESVVKRKDNKNKFSTGCIFKSKGYQIKYLYGGDAFFDNMQDFYKGNGYDIVDKSSLKPNEISFSNIWGVCDEDMAKKAIKVMNAEYQTGKPFFNHWMTVSNHRPFTYPDGKIDIPANSKSRNGGVKYTDYALKQFFALAEKQPWFKNTVFVIVADHCASSSGKVELPLEKYRIPAMIYAPGFIKSQKCNTLMSQIDLMPTALGLLNFKYRSKFFGENIFNPTYTPRAFIATYQDLGYIKDNYLTIISPVKRVKQFVLKPKSNSNYEIHFDELANTKINKKLEFETIAFYEEAALLLKNHKYQAIHGTK
ncbi:Probable phosphoglycerol transferase [Flavobacterium indicum GPTSA100-9 = DSM 17447]|uniref:Probable phosphoglycerol transferase n=1 Tax=Flavobacterium indicum (strain DSM 17447 / CIP 109464 / GPTSA100-9) TaxID=1094466 RepID=H8XQR1_FLAIG|nr:alkaline phosphatase family protein [Flavobacterium indicum]CCG53359.1 Probable phosphoglycerol transferase [Flavobacterium indicum GPTSA100-9 = DSM 17447]